jgi:DNA-binding HxlR family transcriptional regulator
MGHVGTAEIAARVLSCELKTLTDMGVIHRIDYQVPPKGRV